MFSSIRNTSEAVAALASLGLGFVLIIFVSTTPTVIDATQSGIYIDNGKDQTIMHRVLSDDDKLDVSYEILEFLGIAERPTHHSSHPLSLRKSAPKFLLDVYHRITEDQRSCLPMAVPTRIPTSINSSTSSTSSVWSSSLSPLSSSPSPQSPQQQQKQQQPRPSGQQQRKSKIPPSVPVQRSYAS
ncbi:GL11169 [Drosophila persimilis]|uniref:GL11169 n=1 Tax=Drosophila persimilis TaxID=7234 RepID=B4GCQ7_DROPE|nr:GL11169 [Drosophila persimilis]